VIPSPPVRRTLLPGLAVAALALASCAQHLPPVPPPMNAGAQCLAELDRLGVVYEVAPTKAALSPCEVDIPVRVSAAAFPWNQSGIVACRFAATLDRFATDDVAPLAEGYFHEPVVEMSNFGTYACHTTDSGHPSQNAVGRAIDIASFRLEDGTVISVAHDWRAKGVKGRFLHAVARAACERFSVVLTPDADRDHWNHIHVDSGPYRLCGMRGG
jgi:hypothetical protein